MKILHIYENSIDISFNDLNEWFEMRPQLQCQVTDWRPIARTAHVKPKNLDSFLVTLALNGVTYERDSPISPTEH